MPRYEDEDLYDALRAVAERVERNAPTADQYRELADDDMPTARTIINRHDDHENPWFAALDLAALDPDPYRHTGGTEWRKADCKNGIKRAACLLAEWPSSHQYRQLRQEGQLDDFPSADTIRGQYGEWEQAVDVARKEASGVVHELMDRGPLPPDERSTSKRPRFPYDVRKYQPTHQGTMGNPAVLYLPAHDRVAVVETYLRAVPEYLNHNRPSSLAVGPDWKLPAQRAVARASGEQPPSAPD